MHMNFRKIKNSINKNKSVLLKPIKWSHLILSTFSIIHILKYFYKIIIMTFSTWYGMNNFLWQQVFRRFQTQMSSGTGKWCQQAKWAKPADNWKRGEHILSLKEQLLLSVPYRNALFQRTLKISTCGKSPPFLNVGNEFNVLKILHKHNMYLQARFVLCATSLQPLIKNKICNGG